MIFPILLFYYYLTISSNELFLPLAIAPGMTELNETKEKISCSSSLSFVSHMTDCLTNGGNPIPHATIVSAFQSAPNYIGQTFRVVWSYMDKPGVRNQWDGRVLGFDPSGKIRIFYWRQKGFPKLQHSEVGIEVLLPRDDVAYYSIKVIRAAQVTDTQLHNAMENQSDDDDDKMSVSNGGRHPFALHDVVTWEDTISSPGGADYMKLRVSQLLGESITSSARRKDSIEAIHKWIDVASRLQGWDGVSPVVELGQLLVRQARLVVAEETQKIRPDDIMRQITQVDETDPVGRAIATLSKQKNKGTRIRFCKSCEKWGHDEAHCFRKQKNGDASGKK